HPILGRPMIEHCFERAKKFKAWDGLFIATCGEEIRTFAKLKGYPVIMTADSHTRALDRVAEAIEKCGLDVDENDIIVCVQGDEPLLGPDVIEAVTRPLLDGGDVESTMLSVPIIDEEQYRNPDIVKIVDDLKGNVMFTSRSPIPYAETFSPEIGAKRVGGIFAFRLHALRWFTGQKESPLEIAEACDSNRIYDNGRLQRIAPIPYRPYFSVDSPEDIARVEGVMKGDPLWGTY
ncbi:MAG TPA: 3-deoxy-manno-octulosonate cytidylyltransferase, partial [Rhodospirillales bacterium]|nr:3-deoxy-manno-octulosonate cytidylyltransferase [Rhodospirillales bacterium]